MRLIQFQGSTSGRPGWMAPIILTLALMGAVVVMAGAAIVGTIALVAGGVMRLLAPASAPPLAGRRPGAGTLVGGILGKLFAGGKPQERTWPEPAPEREPLEPRAEEPSTPKTISMDRGHDGIWRR